MDRKRTLALSPFAAYAAALAATVDTIDWTRPGAVERAARVLRPIAGGQFGTLSVLDTLAASQATIAAYGEDNAFREIEAALAAYNRITTEMLGDLVERTEDRQRRYGSNDSMAMEELDEFGRPQAQKITAGSTVGFPLRHYGIAIQWTRTFFQVARASELAAQTTAAMAADLAAIQREIKRAIFNPTNATFLDTLVDNVSLAVKRLVNADSAAIPLGPNGETFDASTHTHYNYSAGVAIAAADLQALVEDVIEHHGTGTAVVYINRAQETAVRALTGFTALLPARLVPANTAVAATGALEDDQNLNDRLIGYFNAGGVYAEIQVKPWIPAGYLLAWVRGGPTPLVMRVRPNGGNLQLAFEDERYPLRARAWERDFGMAVWNRTNGAVLYIDTGAAGAYVAPTIS